jgi:hypothetical protein
VPSSAANTALLQRVADGQSIHPCSRADKSKLGEKLLAGGDNCSTAVHTEKGMAPVFYSGITIKTRYDPTRLPGEIVHTPEGTFTLDHFLIPTIMEGNYVVWLALKRRSDPASNRALLEQYRKGVFEVAGFGPLIFQTDDLGIPLAFKPFPLPLK